MATDIFQPSGVPTLNSASAGSTIHHGTIVINSAGGGGHESFIAYTGIGGAGVSTTPIYAAISGVYETRFDDERYYVGDTSD